IRYLQNSLNNYVTLLKQLDLNTTQEMDSIEEHPQDSPITSINTITTMDDEIHDNIDAEIDEEKWISATSSTSHTQRHYQSLLNCIFQERPIIRRQGDYDIEDPT
ncbi:unnamed protein product, partial [Rotaria magnacalcarata]